MIWQMPITVVGGYGADVLDQEPPNKNHPLPTQNSVITLIWPRTLNLFKDKLDGCKNLILPKREKPLAQRMAPLVKYL